MNSSEECQHLLEMFQAENFFDCTIRVSSPTSLKDFKCHKLILSMASAVFKTMFTSKFKESKMGINDPIPLERVDPLIFDCAMKFVYGRVKDFQSIEFGVQVYKFAHEMQIVTLMKELEYYFYTNVKAEETFAIFDLFKLVDYQFGLDVCKKGLKKQTAKALRSNHWLSIGAESVLEFLGMDSLGVSEYELVKALVRWGKFQVQSDGHQPTNAEKLRSKILAGLKLISFTDLEPSEFADLCLHELRAVLSESSKSSIFMCLVTGDHKLMPENVGGEEVNHSMSESSKFSIETVNIASEGGLRQTATVTFICCESFEFFGLSFWNVPNFSFWKELEFKLMNDKDVVMGKGALKNMITDDGDAYLECMPKSTLAAATKYSLKFSYTCVNICRPISFWFRRLLLHIQLRSPRGNLLSM